MDFERQIQAYSLIEALVNDGHKLSRLPIDKERATGILECRVEATEQDLKLLEQARALAMTRVMEK